MTSSNRSKINIIVLLSVVVPFFIAGCISPVIRNLATDPYKTCDIPKLTYVGKQIYIEKPSDKRPQEEKRGGSRKRIRYIVPTIILNFWSNAGPRYHEPFYLGGESICTGIRDGLRTAVSESELCKVVTAKGKADYILKSKIRHLYGVCYEKSFCFGGFGAAMFVYYDFLPAAQATIEFSLVSRQTDKVVSRWTMSEGHIFTPDQRGADTDFNVAGQSFAQQENNRTNEILYALGKIYMRLPGKLERELARFTMPSATFDRKSFFIARQLHDYENMEFGQIDYETGKIISTEIVRRKVPVFSSCGKWVVSPYQPNLIPKVEYLKLLDHLKKKYHVGWTDNLTAAKFGGLKEQ